MLRFTQFYGYKVVKKQKPATLFLPFEYFIASSISPSGSNDAKLSMRDRLRKRSHHSLGIGRVTPAIQARNTATVVKSGKKSIFHYTRLSARISFLDTEMKIQIRAPNKFTNKVIALRMNVAARLHV